MTEYKTVSRDEIDDMDARGEVRFDPNAPEIDDADALGFWDTAQVVAPPPKSLISMRVDPDIVAFFKARGPHYTRQIHAVLRTYVDAKTKAAADAAE